MENKKIKEIFILMTLCLLSFGVLCITGCGGKSCETVECGTFEEEGFSIKVYSIPGCGGCFSSGEGCDSCLWSQSHKMVIAEGNGKIEGDDVAEGSEAEEYSFIGCDNRYYGNGFLGCAGVEKSCYCGSYTEDSDNWSVFYGDTDSEAKILGCEGGNVQCTSEEGTLKGALFEAFEFLAGVD